MFKSILVPLDLNAREASLRALPIAVELARNHGAELHVMTVVPEFGMPIVADKFPKGYEKHALLAAQEELQKIADKEIPEGFSRKIHIAHGSIYKEIISQAEKLGCDLIVMASHRPELSDYLLGPNAARVVRHARQSVMVVRE